MECRHATAETHGHMRWHCQTQVLGPSWRSHVCYKGSENGGRTKIDYVLLLFHQLTRFITCGPLDLPCDALFLIVLSILCRHSFNFTFLDV